MPGRQLLLGLPQVGTCHAHSPTGPSPGGGSSHQVAGHQLHHQVQAIFVQVQENAQGGQDELLLALFLERGGGALAGSPRGGRGQGRPTFTSFPTLLGWVAVLETPTVPRCVTSQREPNWSIPPTRPPPHPVYPSSNRWQSSLTCKEGVLPS